MSEVLSVSGAPKVLSMAFRLSPAAIRADHEEAEACAGRRACRAEGPLRILARAVPAEALRRGDMRGAGSM